MTAPETVYIAMYDETRSCGEKRMPGVVRVLVGGEHCGAAWPSSTGWTAQVHGLTRTPPTCHATAADALTAVLDSPWARRLGHRAASRLHFSLAASRAITPPGDAS